MGAPYSQDLRLRVLAALDEGMSKMVIHRLFRVARSTIDDWLHLREQIGNMDVAPGVRRGPSAKIDDWGAFETFARHHRHKTLVQMSVVWEQEKGQRVSHTTLAAMKKIGWTRKKRAGSMQSVWGPALP
ncbi:hypothetical protein IAD21_00164 [Abditibacteriota bacterium]|nr:hypothetical protein IAD21_00164 [Abditibacteriota bacterium]